VLNVPFFWQPDCRLLHCAIAGYPPKSSISQNSSISLGIYPPNPWNQPLPFTISMEIDGWSSYSHIFICIYIYIHIFLIRTNHILEYPPYHPIPHAATLPLQSCCCLCIPFPTRSYYIPLYPIISLYIPLYPYCSNLSDTDDYMSHLIYIPITSPLFSQYIPCFVDMLLSHCTAVYHGISH